MMVIVPILGSPLLDPIHLQRKTIDSSITKISKPQCSGRFQIGNILGQGF